MSKTPVAVQLSPTGAHQRGEQSGNASRFERKVRRSFAKLVSASPDAVDTLVGLMGEGHPDMVRYLSARFVLSAVGLGEISKQVQKTTTQITMEHQSRKVEEGLARVQGNDIDQLLGALQERLEGQVTDATLVIEGESVDDAPAADARPGDAHQE